MSAHCDVRNGLPAHDWTDQPDGVTEPLEQRVWHVQRGNYNVYATSCSGRREVGAVVLSSDLRNPDLTPEQAERVALALLAAAADARARFAEVTG